MDKMIAVVLAAGAGKRMNSKVAKQYIELNEKPVLWYALQAFSQSELVSRIVLVVGHGEEDYVQKEIVDKYGFEKVALICEGGAERYLSVWNGLQAIRTAGLLEDVAQGMREDAPDGADTYIAIHDGARPFVTQQIIEDTLYAAKEYGACVAGMPVKDTIKIADEEGFAQATPKRDLVWAVQTPQVFEGQLIYSAYAKLISNLEELISKGVSITDDAMVVEHMTGEKVKLVKASYENIKITTPEDLILAKGILEGQ
ncbi:MAG: 2-C-methyl-D-erythritol 4-phosphate cytidylyltransferase [Lachnospiraceae bacterium]|nr:2-C-methyl-D-erythritol 4-phosphate cytidylyltransferase [Lachnospiraceae bacterium]